VDGEEELTHETPLKAGWRVRALTDDGPTVRKGDEGVVRQTGLREYHLIFWERAKSTKFVRGINLEHIP
jgi:hypothetical protein